MLGSKWTPSSPCKSLPGAVSAGPGAELPGDQESPSPPAQAQAQGQSSGVSCTTCTSEKSPSVTHGSGLSCCHPSCTMEQAEQIPENGERQKLHFGKRAAPPLVMCLSDD